MRHISTRLVGGICGPIWWPVGAMCGKPLNVDIGRVRDRLCGPGKTTLRDILLSVDNAEGGDFQSSKFTADTEIEVRFWDDSKRRYVTRYVPLLELPAAADVADMVNADCLSSDFCGEED